PIYLDFCAAQYPNAGFISCVEQIAERLALLILQISMGVESTMKTSVKSENLLLKVSLIFSMYGKSFLLLLLLTLFSIFPSKSVPKIHLNNCNSELIDMYSAVILSATSSKSDIFGSLICLVVAICLQVVVNS